LWLRKLGALEDSACPVVRGFAGSLRLRLGLHLNIDDWKPAPAITATCPGCKTIIEGIPAARDHSLKCASWGGGYGVTQRHHAVRDSVAELLTEAGAIVSKELSIDADRIMDIVASTPEGHHYWLDVGVTSGPPDAMEKKKRTKYDKIAVQHDAKFHPLIFNLQAQPSKETRDALHTLSCELEIPLTRLMAKITAAIVSGNGLAVSKAEAYMRTSIGNRFFENDFVPPPIPVPEVDILMDDIGLNPEAHAEWSSTLEMNDPELQHTFRANTGTVRPDDELGAAANYRETFAAKSNSSGAAPAASNIS
jgi:hypothetical protein